ncbi:unnamed protein product [Meganyctiphanes norvegica]|uniref:Rabenosyn-5 n=1 Tax=Meganyctiphanes norvegica TaxID=48144 RepID=A0AAV2QIP7_MEGNR
MNSDMAGEVREGFLCPICMKDLNSIAQLTVHFEEEHASEDKQVLQSIKGLLSKAKKNILNEDEVDSTFGDPTFRIGREETPVYQPNNPWNWDPLPPGPHRSHTHDFKKNRSARIDSFVAETNKLLIRLDKLLTDLPSDPVKRKAHEKNIVPWADDKDVPLCPFCARSFNVARRRHHCRICGGIMCADCTQLLSFDYAKKMVAPVQSAASRGISNTVAVPSKSNSSAFSTMGSMLSGLPGLRRSGSQGSLNSILSVMDAMNSEQSFRTCDHCMLRLIARDNQVEQKTAKPNITLYYEKLMEYRNEIENLLPLYVKMADSLNSGETTYNLQDGVELRTKIVKLGNNLNSMAQRIRSLGAQSKQNEGEVVVEIGPRQGLLQRRIYSSAAGFLKENILGLSKLPTAEEFRSIQARKRLETEARLMAEKEASRLREERAEQILKRRDRERNSASPRGHSSLNSTTSNRSSIKAQPPQISQASVVVDTGWGADSSAHNVTETDHPLVQQMNIIRNYIRQAREASRYDEVSALETNLKELQEEYRREQRLMNP